MALIRWEPAREIGSLQTEMNRLFSTFFEPAPLTGGEHPRSWTPAMDVLEQEDHYLIRADLPGVRQDDVAVELDGDALSISGERRAEHEAQDGGFMRVERATGSFRRVLTLPKGIDPESVAANFADGVLEVRIPKPAERRPRRVEIAVGDSPPLVEA
jgi:HSP20 family protein